MALLGSRASFTEQLAPKSYKCSECGDRFPKDSPCLVSIRNGRVTKRICGEECRLTFDDRIWQERANENQNDA